MSYLMNCRHQDSGWCLACVQGMVIQRNKLLEACKKVEPWLPRDSDHFDDQEYAYFQAVTEMRAAIAEVERGESVSDSEVKECPVCANVIKNEVDLYCSCTKQAYKELKLCRGEGTEEAHERADRMLCRLLRDLGFNNVVDVYESVDKWYG